MTINEQLTRLRPHIEEDDITEFFICVKNWATPEGKLYEECHKTEDFNHFLEKYGELENLDWCAISSHYGGFRIGFLVASTKR